MPPASRQYFFSIHPRDYDLAATLASGQAFRWRNVEGAWEGFIGPRWLRLQQTTEGIFAETAETTTNSDWHWLAYYLQTDVNLDIVARTFPDDEPMRRAVATCRGLRLLRQEPWECLASFILSSTKQIVQIQQIVALLCARFGEPLAVPAGHEPAFAFPTVERLALCSETELRDCKMGFRAPNLLCTARMIVASEVNLSHLHALALADARTELMKFPGVGP